MSNVIQLILPTRSENRRWDSLQTRIRLFQKKLIENSDDHRENDLPFMLSEMSTFASELLLKFGALSEHLDTVDGVIDAIGNIEIQEPLRRQSKLNREALMEGMIALSQEFEQFLVKSNLLHLRSDRNAALG